MDPLQNACFSSNKSRIACKSGVDPHHVLAMSGKQATGREGVRRTAVGHDAPQATRGPADATTSHDAPATPSRLLTPARDPRLSRSLEYGVAMLESFTAEQPTQGIAEMADLIGISRSTIHRYAITLIALGYLEQDNRRRYRLSHNTVGPGMAAIGAIRRETPAAVRILEDLRDATGHTVSMGVLDRTRVLFMHRLFSHGIGQYEADMGLLVGAHLDAHRSAIGKALLASLGEHEQREILAQLEFGQVDPRRSGSERELARELAHIRLDGIAVCEEGPARGARSIAATVAGPGRSQPMAVSVTVPAQRYTMNQMTEVLGPRVVAAAERM
jgi:IclR family pca regulon transcriptional regulator